MALTEMSISTNHKTLNQSWFFILFEIVRNFVLDNISFQFHIINEYLVIPHVFAYTRIIEPLQDIANIIQPEPWNSGACHDTSRNRE